MTQSIQDLQMFVDTVKYSDDQTIFIQPLCEYFGIQQDNQLKRIKNDLILATSTLKNTSMLLFGDERERVCLTKRGFVRWIQLLNPQIVQVSLREKLATFQVQIFDYLFSSAVARDDMQAKSMELIRLRNEYSIIGNQIQKLTRELTEYADAQLGINISRHKPGKNGLPSTN